MTRYWIAYHFASSEIPRSYSAVTCTSYGDDASIRQNCAVQRADTASVPCQGGAGGFACGQVPDSHRAIVAAC